MRDKGVCKILTILVAFMMVVSCAAMPSAGGVSESEVNLSNPDNTTSTELNKNLKLAFSSYYQPINISVNLNVPPYQLPMNLSTISNSEDITKLRLNETEEELLETNGFVILDYGQEDDIVAPYKDMKEMGIPIFVTTDTPCFTFTISSSMRYSKASRNANSLMRS